MIAGLLLWGALAALLYVYAGYPLLLAAWGAVAGRPVEKRPGEPRVTVLIAAHNEERHLGATIRNKLALDYPRDRLEVVVISDGSTDRTEEVAAGFAPEGVRLIRQRPRAGKTAALNRGAAEAGGEILVFSDANSLYEPGALRALVEDFADPRVGYVTGRMVYVAEGGSVTGEGCGAYMRYENRLRELETRVGSVVGVDGGIDAVRRELFSPLRPDQLPDFVLPLRVVEQGYRVVYEPRALLGEPALRQVGGEYRMRVRVTLRALWALWDMRHLMNPLRHGLFAVQLLSHKLLRYLAFLPLAVLLGASLAGAGEPGAARVLLALQGAFYLGALAGLALGGRAGPLWPAVYFSLLNVASAHAFLKFLRGEKQVVWEPRLG